jgi:hypothetical protein
MCTSGGFYVFQIIERYGGKVRNKVKNKMKQHDVRFSLYIMFAALLGITSAGLCPLELTNENLKAIPLMKKDNLVFFEAKYHEADTMEK